MVKQRFIFKFKYTLNGQAHQVSKQKIIETPKCQLISARYMQYHSESSSSFSLAHRRKLETNVNFAPALSGWAKLSNYQMRQFPRQISYGPTSHNL